MGVTIVAGVIIVCIVAAVIFARSSLNTRSNQEKYPAEAFVIKRQGSLKSKTTYTGIAAGNGMKVDMKFDQADQKLMLKILDSKGKPMPRVTLDARASKPGQGQIPKRFIMKEYDQGEYRSDPMDLKKGNWVLMLSAYDLYNRNDNKLLFHTEQPIFLK